MNTERTRPRWAQLIHNLGDDLRWALSAWCDFPRPVRRLTAAITTALFGWFFGAPEVISQITQIISA